jgi:hypothetical protein
MSSFLAKDDITVGKNYIFNAGKLKEEEQKINFVFQSKNQSPIKKYNTWKKCHGAKVKVLSKSFVYDDVNVCFTDYPDRVFALFTGYLSVLEAAEDTQCNCKVRTLMICGCKCGAFQKENIA